MSHSLILLLYHTSLRVLKSQHRYIRNPRLNVAQMFSICRPFAWALGIWWQTKFTVWRGPWILKKLLIASKSLQVWEGQWRHVEEEATCSGGWQCHGWGQSFCMSMLVTFGAEQFCAVGDGPVHHRSLGSIPVRCCNIRPFPLQLWPSQMSPAIAQCPQIEDYWFQGKVR